MDANKALDEAPIEDAETEAEETASNEDEAPTVSHTTKASAVQPSYSAAHSLWYLLAILSVGVPQAFLVYHLLPCFNFGDAYEDDEMYYEGGRDGELKPYYWETDLDILPSDAVKDWAKKFTPNRMAMTSQQCHLSSSNGTALYFAGTHPWYDVNPNDRETTHLAVFFEDGGDTILLDRYTRPSMITKINERDLCFMGVVNATNDNPKIHGGRAYQRYDNMIVCGHYGNFSEYLLAQEHYVAAFKAIGNLLWSRQVVPQEYATAEENPLTTSSFYNSMGTSKGYAILSMDITTMKETVWSELRNFSRPERGDGGDADDRGDYSEDEGFYGENRSECVTSGLSRWESSLLLFFSALPIALLSANLWMKKAVPTSSIALYIGFSMIFKFGSALFDPWSGGANGLAMWLVGGSAIWLLVSAFQLTVKTRVSRPPFWWSLYAISVGLIVRTGLKMSNEWEMYNMYAQRVSSYEVLSWVCNSLFVFLPISLIGSVTNSRFLFCVGMLGLLFEAIIATIRLASEHDAVNKTWAKVLLICAEVAIFGSMLVMVLCKWHAVRDKLVRSINRCARQACVVESADDDDGESSDEVAGLLPNETAEAA